LQSFAEFVAESFYSEVPLIWKLKSTTNAPAMFSAGTVSVEVSFEQREPKGSWHVGFNVVRGEAAERTLLAFRIFNGVFQAVREFIETREPDSVVFIAKDEDLASIYHTYLRREKAAIEELGYVIEAPNRVEPYTEFTLRRTKPSNWRE
jgi:hypothetical protein